MLSIQSLKAPEKESRCTYVPRYTMFRGKIQETHHWCSSYTWSKHSCTIPPITTSSIFPPSHPVHGNSDAVSASSQLSHTCSSKIWCCSFTHHKTCTVGRGGDVASYVDFCSGIFRICLKPDLTLPGDNGFAHNYSKLNEYKLTEKKKPSDQSELHCRIAY